MLTCDTGVAANEAVAYAASRGVDFVVTDHHDLPAVLPQAVAVINPKRLPGNHPLASLPGVGVAYKLAEALFAEAGRAGEETQHLDLAALGIIADVARLTGDTRALAQRGIEMLRHPQRLGLQVMLQLAEVDPTWLTEEHIGFEIAPRLNALGRLDDANPAVEFLTTSDLSRARILATQLEGLNERRKLLTDQVFRGVLAQLEREPALLEHAALVLAHPQWPAGIIGIVASRLVERYRRPVVLLSAPPGEPARGSARSVDGCDISAAIAAQADLLLSYGGHPMAAGLSLPAERINEFRWRLARVVDEMLGRGGRGGAAGAGCRPAAGRRLPAAGAGTRTAGALRAGQSRRRCWSAAITAFPMSERSGATPITAFSTWRTTRATCSGCSGGRARAGRCLRGASIWLTACVPAPFAASATCRSSGWPRSPSSRRRSRSAPGRCRRWTGGLPLIRWPAWLSCGKPATCRSGLRRPTGGRLRGVDRTQLTPAATLVIWTAPASRSDLLAALERVQPRQVVLVGVDPQLDGMEAFLARLAGLLKPVLVGDGTVALSWLAAATAQHDAVVRAGLGWLAARGHLRIEEDSDDRVQVASGIGVIV